MHTKAVARNRWISLVIAVSVIVTGIMPLTASADQKKRKPVVVSFGQPNIWSLEQAHYLLARMHMLNLDLQAKSLTETDLDPNATQGTRIQILKQLLEIGVQFDQGAGFQNKRLVENARFNDARRRELVTRKSAMQDKAVELTGEISDLEIERARLDADKSATDEQKALKDAEIRSKNKELAQVKELISQDTTELGSFPAEAASTPVSPNALPSPTQLPSSVLDALVQKNAQGLLDAARDPKLNATTMLDNTIQLQYEIIAKQLTLLRDEVGPGERLVFLELPQSIYTTPGDGDEKMAQSWWHVNGYTRTDPLLRLLLELLEVELRWDKIKHVKAYSDKDKNGEIENFRCERQTRADREQLEDDPILAIFVGLKCEHKHARNAALDKIYREANSLFARVEQNGARDSSDQIEIIRKILTVTKPIPKTNGKDSEDDKDLNKIQHVEARSYGKENLVKSNSLEVEVGRRQEIDKLKNMLLIVLSRKNPFEKPSQEELKEGKFAEAWSNFEKFRGEVERTQGSTFEKAMEFIRLDEHLAQEQDGSANLQRRTVRSVDIIPRQSSLNVNDIQETVKSTGILAGFKFLFGFAGQVNFQRQREQFEQFLHQELYASGFGKGSRDFGWTFGAIPGTKRVAPGVRTTYAALIVPEDAESIVMSARGCYFPRKSYQPLDFQDTGHTDWDREQKYKQYNCGDEENYVLTIPGGGDVSNFWVTNIDYEDGRKSGDFITVSVRGNNFSSQMGVLIDGVPLFPTVGLAQGHLMPRKAANGAASTEPLASECVNATGICGRYERVDAEQIVFSFKMPGNYTGTPTITLIAPGKSIDLNSLRNVRINRQPNANLRDNAGVMFGATGLSITGFQALRRPGSNWEGYLSGTGFDDTKDNVFVNGRPAHKDFRSANLYKLNYDVPQDENLNVTVVRDRQVVSASYPNPAVIKVNNTTVVSYTPAVKNKKEKKPSVVILKLDGVGFTTNLDLVRPATGHFVSVSPNELIIEITNTELPVVVALRDRDSGVMASGIAPKETKEKETKPAATARKESEAKPKEEIAQKTKKPKQE